MCASKVDEFPGAHPGAPLIRGSPTTIWVHLEGDSQSLRAFGLALRQIFY